MEEPDMYVDVTVHIYIYIYTVSQKKEVGTFAHNFGKCWPIFKILSLLHSGQNLQQRNYFIANHNLNV